MHLVRPTTWFQPRWLIGLLASRRRLQTPVSQLCYLSCRPLKPRCVTTHEARNGDSPRYSKLSAMELDALQGVECVSGDVALATVGTDQDRHVLDHKECRSTPVTAGHVAQPDPEFSANSAPRPFDSRISRHRRSEQQADQLDQTSPQRRDSLCPQRFDPG